jgi:hypothetical protein
MKRLKRAFHLRRANLNVFVQISTSRPNFNGGAAPGIYIPLHAALAIKETRLAS